LRAGSQRRRRAFIAQLKNATSKIEGCQHPDSGNGDAKAGKPLAIARVAAATEQAGELKFSAGLQRIKAETEVRKETLTRTSEKP
jgi:hypothetical protein